METGEVLEIAGAEYVVTWVKGNSFGVAPVNPGQSGLNEVWYKVWEEVEGCLWFCIGGEVEGGGEAACVS